MNFFKAHCCEDNSLNSIRINIGDHLRQEGDEESYIEIQKIVIHPEYRGRSSQWAYDFCMIQTEEKMSIDGVETQVACFPEAEDHVNGNEAQCWTAGWGMLDDWTEEEPLQLQTLKVNVYNDETCFNHALNFDNYKKSDSSITENRNPRHYDYWYDYWFQDYGDNSDVNSTNHDFFDPEVVFCAGYYDETNNTYTEASSCYGDSGGPLGKNIIYDTLYDNYITL